MFYRDNLYTAGTVCNGCRLFRKEARLPSGHPHRDILELQSHGRPCWLWPIGHLQDGCQKHTQEAAHDSAHHLGRRRVLHVAEGCKVRGGLEVWPETTMELCLMEGLLVAELTLCLPTPAPIIGFRSQECSLWWASGLLCQRSRLNKEAQVMASASMTAFVFVSL